jgi:hypothetical protein
MIGTAARAGRLRVMVGSKHGVGVCPIVQCRNKSDREPFKPNTSFDVSGFGQCRLVKL